LGRDGSQGPTIVRVTYKVSVTNLQSFVDTIANLTRSSLPCAVSQLTVVEALANLREFYAEQQNIRDLVAGVESDGLSGRHSEGYVRSKR